MFHPIGQAIILTSFCFTPRGYEVIGSMESKGAIKPLWIVGIPLQGDGIILAHSRDEHGISHNRLTIISEAFTVLLNASLGIGDILTTDVLTDLSGLQGEFLTLGAGNVSSLLDRLATPNLSTIVAQDMRNFGTILEGLTSQLHDTTVGSHKEGKCRLLGTSSPRSLIALSINTLTILIQIDNVAVQHNITNDTT